MKNLLWIAITLLLLTACQPTPKPIDYGTDFCHHCKMTIVDQVHGAELVTKKSKVYKFDAIECLVQYVDITNDEDYSLFLVNGLNEPGTLFDATSSTFLISKAIPSPMGAYLSAFRNEEDAKKVQIEKGGDLYNWTELLGQLNTSVNSMNNR